MSQAVEVVFRIVWAKQFSFRQLRFHVFNSLCLSQGVIKLSHWQSLLYEISSQCFICIICQFSFVQYNISNEAFQQHSENFSISREFLYQMMVRRLEQESRCCSMRPCDSILPRRMSKRMVIVWLGFQSRVFGYWYFYKNDQPYSHLKHLWYWFRVGKSSYQKFRANYLEFAIRIWRLWVRKIV